MRFRQHSELGWMMLQLVGETSLPHVTRDAQKRDSARVKILQGRRSGKAVDMREQMNRVRADTDSVTGTAQPQTRSPDPAPSPQCKRCGQWLGGTFGDACMNCDVDPPGEEQPIVTTYNTRDSLWWLSYADDHRCAGVAIVRVVGDQTERHAADVARALSLEPAGQWQIAAIQVPEEERPTAVAFADRFLTIAEAEVAFQAQSIRSWEEQHPKDAPVDWEREVKVIDHGT